MSDSGNKARGSPGFHPDDDEKLEGFKALLKKSLNNLKHSVMWSLSPQGATSIAEGLAQGTEVAVQVHAGNDDDYYHLGEERLIPATLRKQPGEGDAVELTLEFGEELPAGFNPFALYVGKLDIWQFAPAQVGELPRETTDPVELPPKPAGLQLEEEEVVLGASGVLNRPLEGSPPPLAACGETSREASSERLHLRVEGDKITVRMDQPPLRIGQPVVLDLQYLNLAGQLRSLRTAVTLGRPDDDGDFAGWRRGSASLKDLFARLHLFDHYPPHALIARPLVPADLGVLTSEQVDDLLAGQELIAVSRNDAGGYLVRSEQQRQACRSASSNWFLRVARKEVL